MCGQCAAIAIDGVVGRLLVLWCAEREIAALREFQHRVSSIVTSYSLALGVVSDPHGCRNGIEHGLELGDSLALTLAKCVNLEDSLLNALNDEKVLATLSTTEKERLLGKVTIAKGVAYDKWRLQTGKSTSNNSHELQLRQAHASLPFPTSSGG